MKEHRDREGGLSTIQADTVDRVSGDTVLMNRDDHAIEECKLIPLPDLQKGPAHVAWMLIAKYGRFNDEQVDVMALMVWPMELAWHARKDKTTHCLPLDLGLPRVTIMLEVMVPLLENYFGTVIRSASSNRAARGFGGKTMHSLSGLKGNQSLRTSKLGGMSHAQRKKLGVVQGCAGAWLMDEFGQMQGALFHAGGLRTTYARARRFNLNPAEYAQPRQLFGKISFLAIFSFHKCRKARRCLHLWTAQAMNIKQVLLCLRTSSTSTRWRR